MAYTEKAPTSYARHAISLEGRTKLSVTGVDEVVSFDEQEIVCLTTEGSLIIRGSGLHIDKIDLDNGDLAVSGTVVELRYEEAVRGGSLWTRLFK